jgi:hypothetical protein
MAFEYGRRYDKLLRFRLVVTDYSWALMHIVINGLNSETMVEYSHRVFQLANGELSIKSIEKSWIASCSSHAMKRFT